MSNKVILKAEDLDGYLTQEDMAELKTVEGNNELFRSSK